MPTINYLYHEAFNKDIKSLKRKYPLVERALEATKLLFDKQFCLDNPQQIIHPAKIHRLFINDIFSIWKIEMVVKNLKPNQFPRVWFAVKRENIFFLSAKSHVDNYDDGEMTKIATERMLELL